MLEKGDKHKRVRLIRGENSCSVGEALRDINSMNIIKGDFLLVGDNLVTNLDIDKAYSYY